MEPHDAVAELVLQAERLRGAAKHHANVMAKLIVDNLKSVSSNDTLAALKRELADYSIHTGRWRK